jgi:hypothetical protein
MTFYMHSMNLQSICRMYSELFPRQDLIANNFYFIYIRIIFYFRMTLRHAVLPWHGRVYPITY